MFNFENAYHTIKLKNIAFSSKDKIDELQTCGVDTNTIQRISDTAFLYKKRKKPVLLSEDVVLPRDSIECIKENKIATMEPCNDIDDLNCVVNRLAGDYWLGDVANLVRENYFDSINFYRKGLGYSWLIANENIENVF